MSLISIPDFPNTALEPLLITSAITDHYNCIAWAFGDDTKWYWPEPHVLYWPPNIRREVDLQSFIELYQIKGYQVCDGPELEIGIEKIAIFAHDDGTPTHAARQLQNGSWTSKLGLWHDVEHTLNALNQSNPYVGSSRVDLQACKLEYSIVSPK